MNWFRKQLLPQSNMAMCFSDPAGNNVCLALAQMYKMDGSPVPALFSNKEYKGAIEHDFNIVISDKVPDWDALSIHLLFTGTSHPDSSNRFEAKCIASAQKQGIYIISFIDHWVNFKLRFKGLSSSEYPNEIWVVDKGAKKLALAEGLPKEKLVVSGNPYHAYLKQYWKSCYKGKEYLAKLDIDINRKHILFAPDPLSLRPDKNKTGFTEDEVLKNLLGLTSSLDIQPLLLIKLHPLQPLAIINKVIDHYKGRNVVLLKEVNIPELIYSVDVVVGFFSNILLDAIAIGKKVIRYFPGDPDTDLFQHATVDAEFVSTYPALQKAINKAL